ncbi:hypothetical protein HWV62_3068 [Athelia sp. TMB]|nr:hypothetical protein HWV62_3068 [Athelia sp. TMB]
MLTKKRTETTVDDLLRQQEEPDRKRRRVTPDQVVGVDSSAEEEDPVEKRREGGDDLEVGLVEGEASESDGSEEEEQPRMSPPDRFNFNRTSFKRHDLPKTFAGSSFMSIGVSAPLQAALSSMSIRTPTEIQAACIPQLLAGEDCIGNAKTGSGKTVAFAIPILQRLSADPYGIFALVLTPTRELAFQIAEQFAVLGGSLNTRTAVIVGGMDMMSQALELGNRPHVVVATPGRIVDHLRSSTSGEWDLSRVKFLVLDEADRLLTPTFAPDLAHLFSALPKERQTCLFTATLTPSIDAIASAPSRPGKEKPFIHRMIATTETVDTLKQHYILVPSRVREPYLYHLLCNPPESTISMRRAPTEPEKHIRRTRNNNGKPKKKPAADEDEPEQPPPTIIFCTKPKTAAYLTNLLKSLSIRSTALHSRLTQRERLSSLSLFRSSVIPVLVSTDVGARGLDIDDVAMVINWDMPNEPEEYTHRVGRTARAGKGGIAISFVTEKDEQRVLQIEARIKTKLLEIVLPESKVLEKLNVVSTAKRLATMVSCLLTLSTMALLTET